LFIVSRRIRMRSAAALAIVTLCTNPCAHGFRFRALAAETKALSRTLQASDSRPIAGVNQDRGVPALSVRGLTKLYGETLVLRDVSFEVRPGEAVAIAGENGAGKSTLLDIISGVKPPDAGRMQAGGAHYEPRSHREANRRGIFRVFQESSLVPTLAVYENLLLSHEFLSSGSAWRSIESACVRRRAGFWPRPGCGLTSTPPDGGTVAGRASRTGDRARHRAQFVAGHHADDNPARRTDDRLGRRRAARRARALARLAGAGQCDRLRLASLRGDRRTLRSGLGALSIYRGIGLKLINGSPVPFTNPLVSALAIGQAVPSVANVALWSFAAWLVAWFVCFKTRFGLYIYAIGGSERVARLAGIAVDRWKIAAFALSGATAAIGGLFSVGQLGSADPTLGSSFLLDSLAAIVVGGTSLSGGIGGVQRTLLGVLVISILDDGLNLRGVDEFTAEIVKGL